MGLDQYAFSKRPKAQTSFKFISDEYEDEAEHFAEWRKHNRLQGWMEHLWQFKGCPGLSEENSGMGLGSDFNCIDLELDLNDLEGLERVITNKALPETQGFFFGDDSYAEYENKGRGYKQVDMEFIKEAKKRIKSDHKIYYGSWW